MRLSTVGKKQGGVFVEDSFLVNVRDGTGATANIDAPDMTSDGGLCITTARSTTTGWRYVDTERGATKSLASETTGAEATESTGLTAFTASGVTFGADADYNASGQEFVDYFIKKQPRFFDVVTYTGDGNNGKTMSHNLNCSVGMMIVKNLTTARNWIVYNKGNTANPETELLRLNTTDATVDTNAPWYDTAPTETEFTVGYAADVNALNDEYVAYLFAHDPFSVSGDNGLINCGSFTTDGSGNVTVDFGWTNGVQYIELKASSATGDWEVFDTARTPSWSSTDARLRPNLSNAEDSVSRISISGTSLVFAGLSASTTYIFTAIKAI